MKTNSDRLKIVPLCFVLLFLMVVTGAAEEVSIPLTVHETLRAGVSGVDRKQEPVTVGIPLPRGVVYEKDGAPPLSLKGTDDCQFRTLKKWPDGSVRWTLVDFQTDVNANSKNNTVLVTRGNGTSSGRLAEDRGQLISVKTGVMDVEIRKKGFNLFDSVVIGGREIISKGTSRGIVVMGEGGNEFLASHDAQTKVSIEENGPVRAVIKAEGTHFGSGRQMMNYTVRMHFYKGKSRIKVFYTLRNASKDQVEHAFIRSLDLSAKIVLSGPIDTAVSKHNGVLKERLAGEEERIAFYQAVSGFPQNYAGNSFYYHAPIPVDYTREKEQGFIQEGYWIRKGSDELARGKKAEYPDVTYLDVTDGQGGGVTVGVRFAAGWWPKALRARGDGTVEVGLWPAENEVGYWIRYGSHNTFEVMYDFHATRSDPASSMELFQYPLVAKAPVEWYNRCVEGIYPLYHFVSFEDEKNFVKNNGWEYRMSWHQPKMRIWRYHYWGEGGFLNQHDFARIGLVNFLRRTDDVARAGEDYLYADTRFNYNADWAIFHSDDYDSSKSEYEPTKNKDKASLAKVNFEIEHMHWYGLPLYYYVTGDERIREAVLDFGDVIKGWAKKNFVITYERFFGWEMYSLAAMYDFTGDPSFMKLADTLFERLLLARYNEKNPWSNIFIDWDRGFIMRGEKIKPGLMTGYIIFDGLYNYYLAMDDKNPLRKKVADVLEGLSDFMYREAYVEGTKKLNNKDHWAFWVPYIYYKDDKSKSNHSYRLISEALYVNLAPYLSNGGPKWLDRMDKIVREAAWDESGVWGGFAYMDHPGLQSILYERLHPRASNTPPAAIQDFTVEVKGKDVALSWTAPANVARYQIKFSPKKLVESLLFDPDNRTYKYDPNEYSNWWAGENIPDEPNPGPAGTRQSFQIKGLKPGRYYFAIRSWDKDNNRSGMSNIPEVEIK